MPTRRKPTPKVQHPESRRASPELLSMLELARRVTKTTDAPVVGALAVALHDWRRFTGDIDIYSADFWATHQRLEAAGIMWDSDHREHVIDGVAVQMAGDDSLGGSPTRVSTIEGVKVIGLADLIRGKLAVDLEVLKRAKDIVEVLELIRLIPLKKTSPPNSPDTSAHP